MKKGSTNIKVVGVGGSGSNAVSRMARCKIKGVELIVINTDAQDLKKARADLKLRIGRKTTQGLGAGMNPEIGRKSALENRKEISEALKGSDMVFVTCGLGGGTGTGAAPVIAEVAQEAGALTLAVVTRPFSFEGRAREKIARNGIKKIKEKVDTLISISNDRLLSTLDPNVSLLNAFWFCDDILRQAVQGISDLILLPGIINVDFADVRAVMKNAGSALFGVGRAKGEKRAERAALAAINSPLLDVSLKGTKGVLFNISGRKDVSLSEIDQVAKIITQEINPEAKIIFGAVYDEKLEKGEIKVTVIATGF
jgi:cell division protein FtsZ